MHFPALHYYYYYYLLLLLLLLLLLFCHLSFPVETVVK